MHSKKSILILIMTSLLTLTLFVTVQAAATYDLIILSTNDIHGHVLNYDYLKNDSVDSYGLAKVYPLVQEMRSKYDNTILIDNGDTIEGSTLSNYEARVNPLQKGEVPSVIKAMNIMEYDVAGVGNHEFNFGLEYLHLAVDGANFPYVNANVYDADTGKNHFSPYVILDKEIDGKPIKIGVIGFCPPQIMLWDKAVLAGRVYTEEIAATAEKFIPEMRDKGADLIIANAHTGIDPVRSSEHAALALSQIEGIDAIILGHHHGELPGERYEGVEGVDSQKASINGIPTIMQGGWGSHLGILTLRLTYEDSNWQVVDFNSELKAVNDVEPAEEIVQAVEKNHLATIDYIKEPVGTTTIPIKSFFARVTDNEVTQLINDAQLWFADNYLKDTKHKDLPVLSAAAAFRATTNNYTEIDQGGIAVMNIADLYIYPNVVHMVKVNGEELTGWLERSAENYNQIDPDETEDQELLADSNTFYAFNFDIIEGIEYQFDITRPTGQRVVSLTYNNQPVTSEMEFVVVTNNYRSGGGGGHLKDAEIIYELTAENRSVIINYIKENGTITPTPTYNWGIVPVNTSGRLIFRSSAAGKEYIEINNITNIKYLDQDKDQGLYELTF